MSDNQTLHVLIIGAGITGLLIAHGLQQAGIAYTIFESEEIGRWRSKEWTMGIHWGLPLLEGLLPPHLAARIVKDASVDASLDYQRHPNNGAYIFDGVTGESLKDLAVPDRLVRVSRRKLRMLCQEDVDIKWARTLDAVTCNEDDHTVTATFTNGEKYTGTLLVGCDGPRSPVRNFLFASDPELALVQPLDGIVNVSMAIKYPSAEIARYVREATHPVFHLCISPNVFNFVSMQDVPDPERPETWSFYIVTSWLGERDDSLDNAGRMKVLKDKGRQLAEPFRTSMLSIPSDTSIPYIDLGYWIASPWDTRAGLVTLAGDSAHPMPPFRGQGGNHAIQDAHNFVEAVKKIAAETNDEKRKTLQSEVMRTYSDEVAGRGGEEVKLSTKNGQMLLKYEDFKETPYMKQGLSR